MMLSKSLHPSNKKEGIPMLKKCAIALLAALAVSMATPALASDYLGNPRSMKFHYASCRTIKHLENFIPFQTRDEAIDSGYVPCKVCNP